MKLLKSIIFIQLIFISCSDTDEIQEPTGIKPDVYVRINPTKDISINKNGFHYVQLIGLVNSNGVNYLDVFLRSISPDGIDTIINDGLPSNRFNTRYKNDIVTLPNGRIFCTYEGSTLYSFANDYEDVIERTISPIFNNEFFSAKEICDYKDNILVIFDSQSNTLNQYNFDTNSLEFMVGNPDILSMEDGIGDNAGFISIDNMISIDEEIIYVVDGEYRLRKVEKISSGFKVTTVLNSADLGKIIGMSSNNLNDQLYVTIENKGVYRFDINTNSLEAFLLGITLLDTSDFDFELDSKVLKWEKIKNLYIDNEDLYLNYDENYNLFIKISDFKSKL